MRRCLRMTRVHEVIDLDALDKAGLVKYARALGIKATARWGKDTIRQKIEEKENA